MCVCVCVCIKHMPSRLGGLNGFGIIMYVSSLSSIRYYLELLQFEMDSLSRLTEFKILHFEYPV